LYDQLSTQVLDDIQTALRNKNYLIELCRLGEIPPESQDIVAVLDVERPFFHDIDRKNFSHFKDLIEGIVNSGILWVTGAIQIDCKNPRYGMSLGMARTVRTEMELDFATLELEHFNDIGWEKMVEVLLEFQSRSDNDELRPTLEYALSDDVVHVGRFHWTSINNELSGLSSSEPARKLNIGKRGFLNSLYWKQYSSVEPTKNFVQVKNHAVGLNFKDVLISMGIVEGQMIEGDGLGNESAGIVQKVGPDVQGLSPGDRVMIFASGAFATTLTTTEQVCVKIPDNLNFTDAASMPTVYGTVIYSLLDKARLEKGQTVLIHSACGGVGIAAIQIWYVETAAWSISCGGAKLSEGTSQSLAGPSTLLRDPTNITGTFTKFSAPNTISFQFFDRTAKRVCDKDSSLTSFSRMIGAEVCFIRGWSSNTSNMFIDFLYGRKR
jgi:hypothetical protein